MLIALNASPAVAAALDFRNCLRLTSFMGVSLSSNMSCLGEQGYQILPASAKIAAPDKFEYAGIDSEQIYGHNVALLSSIVTIRRTGTL